MSLKIIKKRKVAEPIAWLGAIGASAALSFGVYSLAGKGFVTTIDDPLALPQELVVTSRDASIPLPPQLLDSDEPAAAAVVNEAVPAPAVAVGSDAAAPQPQPASTPVTSAPAPVPGPAPQSAPPAPAPQPAPTPAPQPTPAPAPAPAPVTTTPSNSAPQQPSRQVNRDNKSGNLLNPTETVDENRGKLKDITQ